MKFVVASALSLLFVSSLVAGQTKVQPNVLLIVTDEHNFRTLGCYREQMTRQQAEMWGQNVVVPTPHIDKLAAEGVICTRAYATSPVCSPCRAAMITGRYPHVAGVPTNNHVLDRNIPSLADRLNTAGYRSGYIGKWHLGGNGKPEWSPKVDGGFQFKKYMFNRGHWKKFALTDDGAAVGAKTGGKPSYGVAGADKETFSTDFLTDRTIEFVTDESYRQQPFFAVLSYPDPHGPNTVREPYNQRFTKLPFEKPRTFGSDIPAPRWLGGGTKHPPFRGDTMAQYFGMVQCIDDNIGRLTDALKKTGQFDNTLVVFTSDHGDLCFEHDRLNKGNPYEGSARVPMIFRHPKLIEAQQVYKQPVGTVDVTPTVMGLLALPKDDEDQGRDLSSQLKSASARLTSAGTAKNPPVTFLRNSGTKAQWVAAVDARYKLILSVDDEPWLFDAEEDPDEVLNMYRRPGTEGVAERLAIALQAYGKNNKDPHLDDTKIKSSLNEALSTGVTK